MRIAHSNQSENHPIWNVIRPHRLAGRQIDNYNPNGQLGGLNVSSSGASGPRPDFAAAERPESGVGQQRQRPAQFCFVDRLALQQAVADLLGGQREEFRDFAATL